MMGRGRECALFVLPTWRCRVKRWWHCLVNLHRCADITVGGKVLAIGCGDCGLGMKDFLVDIESGPNGHIGSVTVRRHG